MCVGVVNLGEQYSEKFKSYRPEVQFIWELAGETVEVDGETKPRQLSRAFTFSASKKGNLRGFISSWNGVQYSDEQFGEVELFNQVGKACQLNVVLNDTGEYANVDSVIPLPRGCPPPPRTRRPSSGTWRSGTTRNLPPCLTGCRRRSKEHQYQKDHTPTDAVDFPAQETKESAAAAPAPANAAPRGECPI